MCDMIANGVWPRNQGETVRLHPSVPMNTKATVSGGLPWRDSHWPGETNDQLETTNSYLVITVGNLQMQHEDAGDHTFGGLVAAAIKEWKGDDAPAMLDAKDNIDWLLELAYEFRGEGKIKLIVPLLDETELRFIEIFKESADDVLTLHVPGLGGV